MTTDSRIRWANSPDRRIMTVAIVRGAYLQYYDGPRYVSGMVLASKFEHVKRRVKQ